MDISVRNKIIIVLQIFHFRIFPSETCKLKVSQDKFNHFHPTSEKFVRCVISDQGLITQFFDEVGVETNKQLRASLEGAKAETLAHPHFLLDMLQHSIKNQSKSKHCASYTEHMKNVALCIFGTAGRLSYETLHLNLRGSLPSLSTVRGMLAQQERTNEGEFRFEPIKRRLLEKSPFLYVVCSEDDTKVTECPRYDYQTDEVLGLQLPLNSYGVPIRGSFKFTTLAAVQKYMDSNKMATYAKLMTIRSLSPNSEAYHLVIYGTTGCDKASEVYARWKYVHDELAEIGVYVVCKSLQLEYLFKV